MSEELQRDLDLIRSVADRSVMDIEAAGREATAEIRRQLNSTQAVEHQQQVKPVAPSDLDEDDYYQFQRYGR
ncbi:hypothetical protein [Mycobacteroides salmoniphilum]|uniref:hypothetical protein n=1 Tax=Mycobacteroides salmoniphilum TaxID=404941 RepID=UPI000992FC88|nr:hypothetical protein [Mycobacteroides salmoniphilum]